MKILFGWLHQCRRIVRNNKMFCSLQNAHAYFNYPLVCNSFYFSVALDHLWREREALSELKENQGALVTAEAPSGIGVRHHHLKGGSIVLHLMRGAQKKEVAHPKGMAGRPMGLITVALPGERAEALSMMLMERLPGSRVIGALLKIMGTVAALVPTVGTT